MGKEQLVDLYLLSNAKYFPPMSINIVREKLLSLNESQLTGINALELRDPTMMLVISIVGGSLGIDRFLIGDIGIGVLKLLTVGLCGILTIVDWFLIQGKTRDGNLQKILSIY